MDEVPQFVYGGPQVVIKNTFLTFDDDLVPRRRGSRHSTAPAPVCLRIESGEEEEEEEEVAEAGEVERGELDEFTVGNQQIQRDPQTPPSCRERPERSLSVRFGDICTEVLPSDIGDSDTAPSHFDSHELTGHLHGFPDSRELSTDGLCGDLPERSLSLRFDGVNDHAQREMEGDSNDDSDDQSLSVGRAEHRGQLGVESVELNRDITSPQIVVRRTFIDLEYARRSDRRPKTLPVFPCTIDFDEDDGHEQVNAKPSHATQEDFENGQEIKHRNAPSQPPPPQRCSMPATLPTSYLPYFPFPTPEPQHAWAPQWQPRAPEPRVRTQRHPRRRRNTHGPLPPGPLQSLPGCMLPEPLPPGEVFLNKIDEVRSETFETPLSVTQRGDLLHVRWVVDARKIRGSERQAVSPQFSVVLQGQPVPFKMMIRPSDDSRITFGRSRGRGLVQLKCEAPFAETLPSVSFLLSLGPLSRGPFTRDFQQSAVCGLPRNCEEWDFGSAVDKKCGNFTLCLDIGQSPLV